jgi:molybdopterin-containing oxidoreductase family membrane subunit
MSTRDRERLLKPLTTTTARYYGLLTVALLATLAFAGVYVMELTGGHLTNLDNWGTAGGVPWGLDIGAFAWWVGIAHGGIAISAFARLLDRDRFKPITRIAELLTLLALSMAVAHIVFDIGRPDRIFNTILYAPFESPLLWDVTIISTYFGMSFVYLFMSMRDDIYELRQDGLLPERWNLLYDVVLLNYKESEREKEQQMLWWLALGILLMIPMLSGGVVPWLFGLLGSQPGWFGAVQGISFLTAALASAMAAVVLIAAAVRYAYGWEDVIRDDLFEDLGKAVTVLLLAYLWVTLHEVVTGGFAAPNQEAAVEHALTAGPYALPFWLAIAGMAVAAVYLGGQWLSEWHSLAGTIFVSLVALAAILTKKTLFVVAALAYPSLMYPVGTYVPAFAEWMNLVGTLSMTLLGYLVFAKIFPLVPISELETREANTMTENPTDPPTAQPTTATDGGQEVSE